MGLPQQLGLFASRNDRLTAVALHRFHCLLPVIVEMNNDVVPERRKLESHWKGMASFDDRDKEQEVSMDVAEVVHWWMLALATGTICRYLVEAWGLPAGKLSSRGGKLSYPLKMLSCIAIETINTIRSVRV